MADVITQLHLRKMSAETSQSDTLDRNGLIKRPLLLKTRSIGELDAVSAVPKTCSKAHLNMDLARSKDVTLQ